MDILEKILEVMEDEVGILGIQFQYVISLQMRKKIWKGKINVVRYYVKRF